MKHLPLLTAAVLMVSSTSLPSPKERVVNGRTPRKGEYPFVVQMRTTLPSGAFQDCTGSIIGRRWILTAAHCVVRAPPKIIAGVVEAVDKEGQVLTVKRAIKRGKVPPNDAVHITDMALIEVDKEIQFGPNVKKVALSANFNFTSYRDCEGMGFGREADNLNSTVPNPKRVVRLNVIDMLPPLRTCGFKALDKHTICIISHPSEYLNHGDSGGPLVCSGVQVGELVSGSNKAQMGPKNLVLLKFLATAYYKSWISSYVDDVVFKD